MKIMAQELRCFYRPWQKPPQEKRCLLCLELNQEDLKKIQREIEYFGKDFIEDRTLQEFPLQAQYCEIYIAELER